MSFFCDVCKKQYSSEKIFNKHLQTKSHHIRALPGQQAVPYKCVCLQSFTKSQAMYQHRKTCKVFNQPLTTDSEYSEQTTNTPQVQMINENLQQQKDAQIKHLTEQVAQLSSLNERVKVLETAFGIMKKTGNPVLPSQSRSKITPSLRLEIKERQNHTCGMCKKQLSDIFQLDHTVALQFGGTNDPDNLMVLCCECHATKSIRENKYKHKIRSAILNILDVGIETNDPQ